ncbi:MAG: nuclear transport factor 2 family protein [Acidobacteria bacterium]|nr:nuclear transport factor 2 family protein [Acidobacteriota bacterium]
MKRFFFALAVAGTLCATVLTQEKPIRTELLSLANAERAFAKMSVEKGIREAFYNNFAEDGINFQPHPTNTREAYRKTPAPTTPPPVTLNWAPIYGDISQAGDLGYTTGPYTVEDHSPAKRPTRHGMYSSVWKKQADGSWKVVLDLGIQLSSAVAPLDAPFQAAPHWNVKPQKMNAEDNLASLLKADREFFEAAKAGASPAWQKFLSDNARIHRNQMMPVVGKVELKTWTGKQSAAITGEPIKADVARSGDFGYSYGKYELKTEKPEKGYYARVWKRDAKGNWRISFDVTAPLPEEK